VRKRLFQKPFFWGHEACPHLRVWAGIAEYQKQYMAEILKNHCAETFFWP
jgi:hypothetical protein